MTHAYRCYALCGSKPCVMTEAVTKRWVERWIKQETEECEEEQVVGR